MLTKRWQPPVSPLVFTAWQLTAGGIVLVPLALAVEGMPPAMDAAAVGGYVYLGAFGTGLAYALWLRGIGRLPVGAVSALTLISPLTATTIDWIALGRPLSASQLVGAVLVLGGVVAAQVGAPEPQAPVVRNEPQARPLRRAAQSSFRTTRESSLRRTT